MAHNTNIIAATPGSFDLTSVNSSDNEDELCFTNFLNCDVEIIEKQNIHNNHNTNNFNFETSSSLPIPSPAPAPAPGVSTSTNNNNENDNDIAQEDSSVLRCLVCNSIINFDGNTSNRNFFDFQASLQLDSQILLFELSKILKISPTIYQGIDIEVVPTPMYCSLCNDTISQCLTIWSEIESLQSQFDTLTRKVQKNFIRSYQSQHSEQIDEKGKTKKPSELNFIPANAAKLHIRKTFVQCWTKCQVNLNQEENETSLKYLEDTEINPPIPPNHVIKTERKRKVSPAAPEADKFVADEHPDFKIENVRSLRDRPLSKTVVESTSLENSVDPYNEYGNDDSDLSDGGSLYIAEGPNSPIPLSDVEEEEQPDLKHQPSPSLKRKRPKRIQKKLNNTLRIKKCRQESGNFRFSCDICGKGYQVKRFLNIHKECHKAEIMEPGKEIKTKSSPMSLLPATLKRRLRIRRSTGIQNKFIMMTSQQPKGKHYPFKCKTCGKGYQLKHYLDIHEKCHRGEVNVPCPDPNCNEKFASVHYMRLHQFMAHSIHSQGSDEPRYDSEGYLISFKCNFCNNDYKLQNYLIDDTSTSSNSASSSKPTKTLRIDCDQPNCTRTFSSFRRFHWHHRRSCSSKPNTIDPKNRSSKTSRTSIMIRKTKAGRSGRTEFPFNCETCGKGYLVEYFLKEHLKVHRGELDFPCQHCEDKFPCAKDLHLHEVMLHQKPKLISLDEVGQLLAFTCSRCNKEYSRNSYMTPSGEFSFQCEIENCGKVYPTMKSFQQHHQYHHESSRRKKKPQNLMCNYCGKPFRTSSGLKDHEIKAHTEKWKHFCEVCGKGCASLGKLNQHKLNHTGEKKYQCDQCEKSFKKKLQLTDHINKHNNVFSYVCDECGKAFVGANALRSHKYYKKKSMEKSPGIRKSQ